MPLSLVAALSLSPFRTLVPLLRPSRLPSYNLPTHIALASGATLTLPSLALSHRCFPLIAPYIRLYILFILL